MKATKRIASLLLCGAMTLGHCFGLICANESALTTRADSLSEMSPLAFPARNAWREARSTCESLTGGKMR